MLINSHGQPVDPFAPIGSCSQCGAAAWTATSTDGLLCPDHAGVWEEMQEQPHRIEKTITPSYETKKNGKRGKLTGYIGELKDGETIISSMEYSTYHEAEAALDALMFELLSAAPAPAEPATTCCFCHKPHHPQRCPDMRALLFAPDVPDYDPDPTAHCVECGGTVTFAGYVCDNCMSWGEIFPQPIDVEFAAFGPQAPIFDINNNEYCPAHDQWFGRMPCPKCYEERRILTVHTATPDAVYAPSLSQAIALGLVGTTDPVCKLCGASAFIWIDHEMYCQSWWQTSKCAESIYPPIDVEFAAFGPEVA